MHRAQNVLTTPLSGSLGSQAEVTYCQILQLERQAQGCCSWGESLQTLQNSAKAIYEVRIFVAGSHETMSDCSASAFGTALRQTQWRLPELPRQKIPCLWDHSGESWNSFLEPSGRWPTKHLELGPGLWSAHSPHSGVHNKHCAFSDDFSGRCGFQQELYLRGPVKEGVFQLSFRKASPLTGRKWPILPLEGKFICSSLV